MIFHVAHNRLADPRLDTCNFILRVDDAGHFVLTADHEPNLSFAPHLLSRGVVCYCRFDESLRCCPKCEHAFDLTFWRWCGLR